MNKINIVLGALMSLTSLEIKHFQKERNDIEVKISILENDLYFLKDEKFKWYEIKKRKKNNDEIQILKLKIKLEKKYLNEYLEIMESFIKSKSLKETIKLNRG